MKGNMARKKSETKDALYHGYDIKWLREVGPAHPDFHFVAEYDKEHGVEEEIEEIEEVVEEIEEVEEVNE